jgi:PAS domain S-box-containing protein
MKNEVVKILLIEDDEDDYILTRNYLTSNEEIKYEIDWVVEYDKALARVKENHHDIYLVDYRLGAYSGIDLLKEARSIGCKKPMIMLTGQDNYQTDIDSMMSGASDFLIKGEINSSLLERAVRYNLERYNSLKSLEEQEVKYRILFEESLDAVFIADVGLHLHDSNFAFRNLFSVTPAEVSKMELKDLFMAENLYKEFEASFNETEYVINKEVILKDSEGTPKVCLISVNKTLLRETDVPIVQGIVKDITTLKEAERELRNSEKMVLTGKMTRTVAHEIRNPLTNILLSLKQLEKKIDIENDKDAATFIQIAEKNTTIINSLIDEMLQASNLRDLVMQSHSLNNILQESANLCKDRIDLQGVKLVIDLDPVVDCRELDIEQLKRAFSNVIINAVEAMSESDEKILTLRTKIDERFCIVSISDTGEGIEEDKINELFEPFFTKKSSGMGLGLTTVKSIINQHNAEIKVHSTLGSGTTFEFYFKN